MPKVTVIMPSLNVAKYIRACMDSVLAQTLQDIEILAIDAGSDDGTLEILLEYAKLDKRIKVIHSDRKSYGYQLNMGISLAQGEYVGIVETDDRIVPDMFQSLYECATDTEADYVKGCALSFMEITPEIIISNRIICTPSAEEMEKTVIPKQNPKFFVTDRFLWLGIYRSDFIKIIKMNETLGAAFQDIGFMFQVICRAGKAVYLDKDVYFYRQDNTSASSYDVKGFRYLVEEYTYVNQFLEGKNKEWYQVYYEKMLNQCLGRFRMMAASGTFWEELVPDMEILREKLLEAVENETLNLKEIDDDTRKLLELFLKGIKDIYEYYVDELQRKKTAVYDMLKVVNHRPVVIFGSGVLGKFVHALLECRLQGLVVAYCDNNAKLHGTKIQGITVLSPESAARCYPDAVYVITGCKSAETMKKQLHGLGIEKGHICIFREGVDMMMLRMK